jgi:hypothetical protein
MGDPFMQTWLSHTLQKKEFIEWQEADFIEKMAGLRAALSDAYFDKVCQFFAGGI